MQQKLKLLYRYPIEAIIALGMAAFLALAFFDDIFRYDLFGGPVIAAFVLTPCGLLLFVLYGISGLAKTVKIRMGLTLVVFGGLSAWLVFVMIYEAALLLMLTPLVALLVLASCRLTTEEKVWPFSSAKKARRFIELSVAGFSLVFMVQLGQAFFLIPEYGPLPTSQDVDVSKEDPPADPPSVDGKTERPHEKKTIGPNETIMSMTTGPPSCAGSFIDVGEGVQILAADRAFSPHYGQQRFMKLTPMSASDIDAFEFEGLTRVRYSFNGVRVRYRVRRHSRALQGLVTFKGRTFYLQCGDSDEFSNARWCLRYLTTMEITPESAAGDLCEIPTQDYE